ncbi:MAG: ATP-binding cassette domain-containing protein [Candidatus Zixiibacteriota bacterium]|nr:MAG: ATP-binding cassette domain-containing protein [candidate division Zixibacteria bacterium]
MSEAIVQLNNVYLKSDRATEVFRDLSLTIQPGESVLVVGSAGSGKTLLTHLLLGLRFPESGAVELFGELVKKRRQGRLRKLRRKIGGVGGPFQLLPTLTAGDNITLPLVVAGEPRRVIRDRLRKVLTEFSLLRQASAFPHQLTRVEQTLVLFARASIANQPLLIVDEPLAGLDLKTADRIYKWMTRVAVSGRSMLILSSDTLGIELPNCRQYRLENGVLV